MVRFIAILLLLMALIWPQVAWLARAGARGKIFYIATSRSHRSLPSPAPTLTATATPDAATVPRYGIFEQPFTYVSTE